MKRERRLWKGALAVAIVALTIAFIWSNSLDPPSVSSEKSRLFAKLIARLLGEKSALGAFLIRNVRKLAHVLEYALLGAEGFCLLALLGWLNGHNILHMLSGTLFIAVLDEAIQFYSSRGSSARDVLIDFSGACAAVLALLLLRALLRVWGRGRGRRQA